MKPMMMALIAVAHLLLLSCSSNPVSPVHRELTELEKRLVQSDNTFGFELFREINRTEPGKNIFISPLSVSMALGMTLNGAAGETRQAMVDLLGFDGLSEEEINQTYKSLLDLLIQLDPTVVFQIANSIWYDQAFVFEQPFIDRNRQFFDAEIQGLDFRDPAAVDIINGWVSQHTAGKIEKIIEQIDPEVIMFLLNAIYFKGGWTTEFDPENTQNDLFNLPDGSQKSIEMMNRSDTLQYFESDLFQAVDLPYGEEAFSMTLLLPKPGVAIDSLISNFSTRNWADWSASFSTQNVILGLPKFKLECEMSLNQVLSTLGMSVAFIPHQADFSKMYTGRDDLYIDEVKHKTFIEVNEEGTEAAAVTSVGIGVTSVPLSVTMRLDRPFVFMIHEHQSQTILFVGKLVDPQ
ncbi:MAG: serpin family protein [bacterium]